MGRPRTFDRDTALRIAMLAFWDKGYEKTSTSSLATMMGISAPSLYAAFGDKRQLFDEAVALYAATPEYAIVDKIPPPTAREAIESMLRRAAAVYTDDSHPRGCLISSEPILVHHREAFRAHILRRIQSAIHNGELPVGTDPGAIAGFYSVVIAGLSARARDGASHDQLAAIARAAIAAWPGQPSGCSQAPEDR